MRAHLREYKFWKSSKKGWRSEGVAEMAVVRYSSTSSFGGLCLSDEDCAEVEVDMGSVLLWMGTARLCSIVTRRLLFVAVCA